MLQCQSVGDSISPPKSKARDRQWLSKIVKDRQRAVSTVSIRCTAVVRSAGVVANVHVGGIRRDSCFSGAPGATPCVSFVVPSSWDRALPGAETHSHGGIGRHHRRHIDGIGGIDGRAFGRPPACHLCAAYGALRLLSPKNLFNRQRSPPTTIPGHAFRRMPIRRRTATKQLVPRSDLRDTRSSHVHDRRQQTGG